MGGLHSVSIQAMAKTTVLLCLWTLMVHASDPLGGLASSDAPAGRSRTILLANGEVGVRQKVLLQSARRSGPT